MAANRKQRCIPWNKGRVAGQKAPLKVREIWPIGTRLRLRQSLRDLAIFNLAIDSKLRACDLLGIQKTGSGTFRFGKRGRVLDGHMNVRLGSRLCENAFAHHVDYFRGAGRLYRNLRGSMRASRCLPSDLQFDQKVAQRARFGSRKRSAKPLTWRSPPSMVRSP